MAATAPAGWYPDPQGVASLRWWDGQWWSAWESDGSVRWLGTPPPPARPLDPRDLSALGMVRTVLLPEAQQRGVVPPRQAEALARLADDLAAEIARRPVGGPMTSLPRWSVSPPAPWAKPVHLRPAGEVPAGAVTAPPTAAPVPAPTVAAAAAPVPGAYGPAAPAPVAPAPTGAAPTVRPSYPPQPAPRRPGPVARWWAASRLRLDTDLTVHGLTYLGVLLLFVGVFGLVAFAFGDVSPHLRPVAELAVALVPFAAAGLLARSGARFVARAMVAVGGLILPVMVVTSTVDGYGVPPDLHGYALPIGAGLACAVVAALYVVWVARRPSSALRAMWAPVLWFAAGMAAVGLARPVPRGEDVAVPGAAQVAVIAVAVLVTTVLASRVLARVPAGPAAEAAETVKAEPAGAERTPARRPVGAVLAAGALTAAPAGLVVTAVLALVAWVAEGWPLVPTVVTTAALALAGAARWPARAEWFLTCGWVLLLLRLGVVDEATPVLSEHLVQPDVALAVRPGLVLASVIAGVGLLEWLQGRTSSAGGTGAPAPGRTRPEQVVYALVGWVVVGTVTLAALAEPVPWWGVAGAALVAGWAAVRRTTAPRLPGARVSIDALAAVAPFAAIGGLWRGAGGAVAGLLAAALAVATTPLARGRSRRATDDVFWPLWWGALVGATVVGALGLISEGLLDGAVPERVVVPLVLALVTAALLAGPGSPAVKVALVTPVLLGFWGAVVAAGDLPGTALSGGYAVLGLGAVVAAHLLPAGPSAPDGTGDADADAVASGPDDALVAAPDGPDDAVVAAPRAVPLGVALAAAGYVTGILALVVVAASSDRGVFSADQAVVSTVALGLATLAWLGTAIAGDRGRSPVVAALDAAQVGSLPWLVALVGVPATVVSALDATGAVQVGHPWWVAPSLVAALGYTGATRTRTPHRLRAVVGWTGFAAAVLAVLLTVPSRPEHWSAVAALAVLIGSVGLLRERHPVVVWSAWVAVAPLAGLAIWNASGWARDLGSAQVAAGTLVVVGGALTVGALLADRAGPRRPRLLPARSAARPPYCVGAVEAVAALLVISGLPPDDVTGALLLGLAAVVGVVAALTGAGFLGGCAVLVAWIGTRVLTGADHPGAWADLGLAALLLLVALAVSLVRPPDARWSRWDVSLAVTAVPPAFTALAVATWPDRPAVYVLVGDLAIGTAVRLGVVPRLRPWSELFATAGSLLVLTGAGWSGRTWLVVALVVLSAGHTALAAVHESGAWRTARQWVGALLAALAWLVVLNGEWLGTDPQVEADVTAIGGALLALSLLAPAAAGRLHRSWAASWGAVAGVLSVLACTAPLLPGPSSVRTAGVAPGLVAGWWQVAGWVLLAVAAGLAARVAHRAPGAYVLRTAAWWRLVAVVPALAALLTTLSVAVPEAPGRVLVLTLTSLAAAGLVLVWRRTGQRTARLGEPPVITFGTTTLALAGGFALGSDVFNLVVVAGTYRIGRPVLVAAVLAVAAVEAAGYGIALRRLGLRMTAPVLAWVAWAVYATDAIGGELAWYTVPVGLATIAVVEVWRADRRERRLPPSDGAVAALDLAGIAFLVVASFVAAFTVSVAHALVAAGIGVLVFLWSVLTRVRRRLLAGSVVVLAALVVAVVLPLVELVPAWGGAALWVLVAVVGLGVVLTATFLERGRAAVRDGRARLLEATAGWE